MRTGRLPAQRLGLGTIVNKDLSAGRRILYWGTTTSGTNDNGNLTLADSSTYMSTVEAALVMGMQNGNATGSQSLGVVSNITYGSVSFISSDETLKHKAQYSFIVIGTPDASYIVD